MAEDPMGGAVARNCHTASRSEIPADYLLSGWATLTPVRRQDDFGVDLYCTLTSSVGQRRNPIVSSWLETNVATQLNEALGIMALT
jgi:hypothetical protein